MKPSTLTHLQHATKYFHTFCGLLYIPILLIVPAGDMASLGSTLLPRNLDLLFLVYWGVASATALGLFAWLAWKHQKTAFGTVKPRPDVRRHNRWATGVTVMIFGLIYVGGWFVPSAAHAVEWTYLMWGILFLGFWGATGFSRFRMYLGGFGALYLLLAFALPAVIPLPEGRNTFSGWSAYEGARLLIDPCLAVAIGLTDYLVLRMLTRPVRGVAEAGMGDVEIGSTAG